MIGPIATETHEVFNQSPPFVELDLYRVDRALQEAVAHNGAAGEDAALSAFGRQWGSGDMAEQARLANEFPPRLKAFDAKGHRQDLIEFHPAYHAFMRASIAAGLHASTWSVAGDPAAAPVEVTRATRFFLVAQVENGHMCPITMTRASVAALRVEPNLLQAWLPRILSRTYDSRLIPWWQKSGVTIGMGMTEKQGGTDVRANTTRAEKAGETYEITGHKWFMSAPMCDAFLVLAQAPAGLTCFLMPRHRPDGTPNGLRFQRLKIKLGNRSNASSEVEFLRAFAWRVGEEGRGIRTILEMVQLTRLDCIISSAGMMRAALAQAIHHARHRRVFQRRLADQPMMENLLAAMALEVEGTTTLTLRLARAFDKAPHDAGEAARARLLTPAAKYWICKSAPGFIYEAIECLGGNGYVEETPLARLYREAPVNAIWEGSGNVMCLDVLRAFARDEEAARAVVHQLAAEAATTAAEVSAQQIIRDLAPGVNEAGARWAVERLALLAAAAACRGSSGGDVATMFAKTHIGERGARLYGTDLLAASDRHTLLERALAD